MRRREMDTEDLGGKGAVNLFGDHLKGPDETDLKKRCTYTYIYI